MVQSKGHPMELMCSIYNGGLVNGFETDYPFELANKGIALNLSQII